METVLIVIHLIIVLALVGVVLLQKSEGGSLGIGGSSGGSGGGFMTTRGAANALTRITALLAVGFFTTSITLTILSREGQEAGSVIDRAIEQTEDGTSVPTAPTDSILDQLQDLQGGNQGDSGPQVPQAQ